MTGHKCAPWPGLERGIVAILRGVKPNEIEAIADALVDAGISAIEIPLNSPDPFTSIEVMAKRHGNAALIGAGTVLTVQQVDRLADAGGKLLVSPNVNVDVLGQAARHAMVTMPGVFTPSEAFTALDAGASALKFFPASVLGAKGIGAIGAVLPGDCVVGAVGGVSEADFATYLNHGAHVFGLGSSLYKPGMDAKQVGERAARAVAAWDALVKGEIHV